MARRLLPKRIGRATSAEARMTEDLYKTLNLTQKASAEDIHRAYRTLALRYHPDRNPSSGAASVTAAIKRAYEVLSEPDKQAVYDKTQVPRENGIEEAVVDAARDLLLKRNWVLVQQTRNDVVLRGGSRCAHVSLTSHLNGQL